MTTPEQYRAVADALEDMRWDGPLPTNQLLNLLHLKDLLQPLPVATGVMVACALDHGNRALCRAVALALRLEALRVEYKRGVEVLKHHDWAHVGVCTLCRAAIGQHHEHTCDHVESYVKAVDQIVANTVRQWWEGQT